MHSKSEWQYHILNGKLAFNGWEFSTPQEYINAFNDYYAGIPDNTEAYLFFVERENKKKAFLNQREALYQQKKLSQSEIEMCLRADQLSYYIDRLDYTGIHTPTGIVVTQLWGRRYEDQQDAFALGNLPGFERLTEKQKQKVLLNTLTILQEELTASLADEAEKSGSTACLTVITPKTVYTANVGDSIALCYSIDKTKLSTLNQLNHKLYKANDPSEKKRVAHFLDQTHTPADEKEWILSGMNNPFDPRLGPLAITAALGDNSFESIGLIHSPEQIDQEQIGVPPLGKTFIILASDGVTEQLSLKSIKHHLDELNAEAATLSESLARTAFDDGSTDNITVLVKEILKQSFQPIYMAVFDGHGGHKISHLCAKILDTILKKQVQNYIRAEIS